MVLLSTGNCASGIYLSYFQGLRAITALEFRIAVLKLIKGSEVHSNVKVLDVPAIAFAK